MAQKIQENASREANVNGNENKNKAIKEQYGIH